jgi:hypothetical protein
MSSERGCSKDDVKYTSHVSTQRITAGNLSEKIDRRVEQASHTGIRPNLAQKYSRRQALRLTKPAAYSKWYGLSRVANQTTTSEQADTHKWGLEFVQNKFSISFEASLRNWSGIEILFLTDDTDHSQEKTKQLGAKHTRGSLPC